MTSDVLPHNPEALRAMLANAEALFLDFDGPVCSVFAGLPAPAVAEQLRRVLSDGGHGELPPVTEKTEDPFNVFGFAASLGEEEARYVEAAMRAHEVEAVATAEPTPGAHDAIRHWRATGRKLAIVSNNAAAAVDAYLNLHNLRTSVDVVSARNEFDPGLLKPNPYLVDQAISALNVSAPKCILVGDSVTDAQAARAAGVQVIGYANKPGKAELFASECLQVVIPSMITLKNEI